MEYKYSEGKPEKMIDLTLYGIKEADILYLNVHDSMVEIIDNYPSGAVSELITLKEGNDEKKIITVGVMQNSQDLEEIVIDYNRYSADARVEIKTYYNEQDGYENGLEKLKLDIVKKNGPDIVETSSIDKAVFINKGIFINLFDFMESDRECNISNIHPSVLKAYEEEGAIYSLAPSFLLYSMWGRSDIIGEKHGISLEELNELLAKRGKGVGAIYGFSADESVLTTLCTYGMDELVNWENKTCDFTGSYFKDILIFSADYKKEHFTGSISQGIQQGDVIMTVGIILDITDYQIQSALYGGKLNFIGYPTTKGSGTALGYFGREFSINTATQEKEAAWDFIRFFLLNGYNGQGFPVLIEKFEEVMQQAAEGEYISAGEEGTIEIAKGMYSDGNVNIEVFHADQSDIEQVKQLMKQI